MVGALVFGALVGILRMALGGHFLSDVLQAATLTSLVVLTLYRLLYPSRNTPPAQS
jgi:membrane-associated phospholipid phosphatase